MINLTIKSSSTLIWLSLLFVQISACDKSDVLTNSTNETSIYEDASDLYISRTETALDRDIEIDQDTANMNQNDMMISRSDLSLDEIDELISALDMRVVANSDASLPPRTESCGTLELNLIMRQIEQPCSDCSIWFWSMGVPENRARLELEYSDINGTYITHFQAGPRGTHGDLWTARILGENPYWGPGSCSEDDPECPASFLHHMQARGTFDGAPLWHGLLYGNLSVIPCDALIIRAHLHLHINEDEGLANADHSSIVALHKGIKIWNPRWVNGLRYDHDENSNTDLNWDQAGGDFGELIMQLEAQRDFWDRGFHKANPNAWFDVTDHLIELHNERPITSP
jgi:hypothetical protein